MQEPKLLNELLSMAVCNRCARVAGNAFKILNLFLKFKQERSHNMESQLLLNNPTI